MKLVKTLMFTCMLALGLSGCASLEVAWKVGVNTGDKILNEETKEKVKPYKEAVEKGYGIVKGKGVE